MKLCFFVFLLALFAEISAFGKTYPTGLRVPSDWKKTAKFDNVLSGVQLPAQFSWLNKLPNWAIKNQGQCGSCWAFAQTGILEAVVQLASELTAPPFLSEQELVSCDTTSLGCRGGYFSQYQVDTGQTDAAHYPYVGKNTRCNKNVPHDVKAREVTFIGDGTKRPTVEEIKTAILTKGPVAVTVSADGPFMNYRSGVFGATGCRQGQTNHMVILTGWDNATNSWQLRNSWGTQWGEKGYMKIRTGCNRVGEIAAYAVYIP